MSKALPLVFVLFFTCFGCAFEPASEDPGTQTQAIVDGCAPQLASLVVASAHSGLARKISWSLVNAGDESCVYRTSVSTFPTSGAPEYSSPQYEGVIKPAFVGEPNPAFSFTQAFNKCNAIQVWVRYRLHTNTSFDWHLLYSGSCSVGTKI